MTFRSSGNQSVEAAPPGVTAEPATPQSRGVVNLTAPLYDFVVRWFVMRGREHRFRAGTLDAAGVRPGDAVLDIGCGTGTLAIQAKHRVGDSGRVAGVEPSKKLLAGALRKAAKERLTIDLRQGGVEQLDFPTTRSTSSPSRSSCTTSPTTFFDADSARSDGCSDLAGAC
jgi:SAM-dependent methyltransferase